MVKRAIKLEHIPPITETLFHLSSFVRTLSVCLLHEKGVSKETLRRFCVVQLRAAFFRTFWMFVTYEFVTLSILQFYFGFKKTENFDHSVLVYIIIWGGIFILFIFYSS